jgi:hypothetical protein
MINDGNALVKCPNQYPRTMDEEGYCQIEFKTTSMVRHVWRLQISKVSHDLADERKNHVPFTGVPRFDGSPRFATEYRQGQLSS